MVYSYGQDVDKKGLLYVQPVYTIYDLSDLTGFSRASIKSYIKKKLIPRSIPAGPNDLVRYTEEHLRLLREIREILDNNMTMADIYDRLHPYTGEDDDD